MKKILFLSILFGLFAWSHAFAAAPIQFQSTQDGIISNITVNSTTSVTFQVTFPVVSDNSYTPLVCVTTASAGCSDDSNKTSTIYFNDNLAEVTTKPTVWNFTQTGLNPAKEYYLSVGVKGEDDPDVRAFTTGSLTLTTPPIVASSTAPDNSDIIVTATINTNQYPYYQGLTGSLIYSENADLSNPVDGGALTGKQGPSSSDGYGINTASTPGVIYWRLTVEPNTLYYYQVTITAPGGSTQKSQIVSFNSQGGTTIVPGTASQQSYNEQHGYTLLSQGFPGLSFLPDPDLCAQERAAAAAGGTAAPQFCDINDVLNYFLKLLIGITGVFLVFRLMYEGFAYMTTDIPFIKASSKGAFMTSLGGLLLVMTSYIILNTINPKLVNETVSVSQLSIGVGGDTNAPTIFVSSGQMPTGVYCPGSGKSSAISQIAQSYKGHVTYSQTNKTATAGPDGNAVLDCSSFVNTVLKCAGYIPGTDFINEGTASIFASAESVKMSSGFSVSGNNVSINNKVLNPGDLVGWTPSQGGGNGHVLIYIGNATFADSHSTSTPGGAIGIYSASTLQSLYGGSKANDIIQDIKRIPSL